MKLNNEASNVPSNLLSAPLVGGVRRLASDGELKPILDSMRADPSQAIPAQNKIDTKKSES
jgi:hypothetical protein